MIETIIDWIKIERVMIEAGIHPATKSELAKRAGLSELTISNVTKGRVGWRGATLDKIANVLDLDEASKILTTYKK